MLQNRKLIVALKSVLYFPVSPNRNKTIKKSKQLLSCGQNEIEVERTATVPEAPFSNFWDGEENRVLFRGGMITNERKAKVRLCQLHSEFLNLPLVYFLKMTGF
jgi:hypothetical protein